MYKDRFLATKISKNKAYTPEGYLLCSNVKIGRTGIQKYKKGELNLTGNPNEIVKFDRPADEVFAPAAMASFNGKPVTLYHPDEFITVDNHNKLSKGQVHNVRRDGEYLVADLLITDKKLCKLIESNKIYGVSCGYVSLDVEESNGLYIQRKIEGNHVALVNNPRAGKEIRILDSIQEGGKSNMKKGLISKLFSFLDSEEKMEIIAELADKIEDIAEDSLETVEVLEDEKKEDEVIVEVEKELEDEVEKVDEVEKEDEKVSEYDLLDGKIKQVNDMMDEIYPFIKKLMEDSGLKEDEAVLEDEKIEDEVKTPKVDSLKAIQNAGRTNFNRSAVDAMNAKFAEIAKGGN